MVINSAFFGRRNITICPKTNAIENCSPNATLAEYQFNNAKRMCDNETSCYLIAGKFLYFVKMLMYIHLSYP